jgi:serine/threonine-protein kinase
VVAKQEREPQRIGRYLVYGPIASGGMATVHFGALVGEAEFSRIVAIKRMRGDKKSDALLSSLVDEARLASRVRHPNVVPMLDVVLHEDEVFVVLEYVTGETLSRLLVRCEQTGTRIPIAFATTIAGGVLHGLHAAHDAKSPRGRPLGIVHRDVSPQNIMVGSDGLARVLDFGIAKASERLSRSVAGQVKGKRPYLAPEQIREQSDRRTDVYATSVVLWEMLAGRRLFAAASPAELIRQVLEMEVPPPSAHAPDISPELDALVLRGLARDPDRRFESARHFAVELERLGIATATDIGGWVQELAGPALRERAEQVAELERHAARFARGETTSLPLARTSRRAAGEVTTEIAGRSEAPSAALETVATHIDGSATIRDSRPPIEATLEAATEARAVTRPAEPSDDAPPQESSSSSRPASRWAPVLVASVAALGVAAIVRNGPSSHLAPFASSTVAFHIETTPTPSTTASASPTPTSSVATSSAPLPTVRSARPAVGSARVEPSATSHAGATVSAKPASPATSTCRYEQFPDERGILITKLVCQ